MAFGGNSRARTFFKQHGWTEGGKIEEKYTSRAADLYRQLLAKEVAKSYVAAPSSPRATPSGTPAESAPPTTQANEPAAAAAAPVLKASNAGSASKPAVSSVVGRKPVSLSGKKTTTAKTTGLGVKKLVSKVGAYESVPGSGYTRY